MNLFNSVRKRELYHYLSNLNTDELKDIFYITSVILKERKKYGYHSDTYIDRDEVI